MSFLDGVTVKLILLFLIGRSEARAIQLVNYRIRMGPKQSWYFLYGWYVLIPIRNLPGLPIKLHVLFI
jgi:hypothetical protein